MMAKWFEQFTAYVPIQTTITASTVESKAMSDHYCPACGSNNIVMIDDFEHDLTILQCLGCREKFAVSNADMYNNSEGWVFDEWANSFARQKRLC